MDYLIDDSDDLAAFLEAVHFWREKLEHSTTPEALENTYQAIPTPIRNSNGLISLRLLLLCLLEAKVSLYKLELNVLYNTTLKMLGKDHELSQICGKDDGLWRLYIESPRLRYTRLEMKHQDYLYLASMLYRVSNLDKVVIFYRKVLAFIDLTLCENELETLSAGCLISQCLLGRSMCGRIGIWSSKESLYEEMFCLFGQTLILDYPHVLTAIKHAVDHPYFADKNRNYLPVLQSLHLSEVDVFGQDQEPQNMRNFIFDKPLFKNLTRMKGYWQQVLKNNPDALALSLQNLWKAQIPLFIINTIPDSESLIYFKHLQKMFLVFFGPDDEYSIDATECVMILEKRILEKPKITGPTCDPF